MELNYSHSKIQLRFYFKAKETKYLPGVLRRGEKYQNMYNFSKEQRSISN